MTRRIPIGLALALFFALSFAALRAQAPVSDAPDATGDETPALWFVELASPPTVDGGDLAQVQKEKRDFRAAATAAKLRFTERYAFDTLWNGLSVRIAKSDVSALARVPGVKAVYPVVPMTHEQDEVSNDPNLFTAVTMTGADIVQNSLGYTGKGVRVAVVDTGIDYNHPDLGAGFGAGHRVAGGYDFVGDAYNADLGTTPVPDDDPMDCAGHGTHVAGIIGAKAAGPGGVTGVAPDVSFYAYRVFGCAGSTDSDIMIAAMERALNDHVDVLNMSIGSSRQWPQYPSAQAATRLVNSGVSVVASAGNDGAIGLYASSAPAVGSKVISVASFDNIKVRLPYFTISPDDARIGYIAASGAPAPPIAGSNPMARTGTTTSTADACTALPVGSLAGKAVLIRRGTCTFYAKAINAQNAGASAVVIYNNTAGYVNATVVPPSGQPALVIPVVGTSDALGAIINARLGAGPVTMTWTDQMASFPSPTGGLISSFSSYGVSPDLELKPDIGAPGGNIYSTFPLALGGYATLSGTSMSSPHVAGAVALLIEAKNPPSNAIRSILQNSAEPHNWWASPSLGFLDNVHRQGAGMLRIDRAVQATTRVEPGKLSLGDSTLGPVTRTLTIANNSSTDVTYTLSSVAALATGSNTFTPSFRTDAATVTFSTPTLTVLSGTAATVDVTIAAPATAPDHGLYGGYIVLTPGAGQIVRVPYSGFKGDYQSYTILTGGGVGLPWLAAWDGTTYVQKSTGATFTMQAADVPFVVVHVDHPVRLLRVDVQDANTGKDWHRALQADYLARNSSATSFFSFAFDGTTTAGSRLYTVPNGQYRLVLSVVKALGDASNPADVETWTSPAFTIARP